MTTRAHVPRFVPDLACKVQPQKTAPLICGLHSVSRFAVGKCAGYPARMTTIIRALATDASGHPDPSDIAAMTAIYHHHVLHGTASFEIDPPSIGDMESRMSALMAKEYPVLIAEKYDGVIVGFAYAGPHKPRAAYNQTVEDSVYLDKDCLGKGIGRQLLTALINAAAARGFYQMMAVIGDSANTASIGLHSALGFRHIGTAQEIGFKFGRRLDIVYMQKALQD